MVPLEAFKLNPKSTQIRPLGNAGGMSGARLYLVRVAGQEYCLRCWPTPHPTPAHLAWVHRQMQMARAAGCWFVPRIHATRDQTTFVRDSSDGRLWELTDWLAGAADFQTFPSDQRLCHAAECLARFHRSLAVEAAVGRPPCLQQRRQMLEMLIAQEPAHWQRLLGEVDQRHGAEIYQLCSALAQQLQDRQPWYELVRSVRELETIQVPLQACLRDIWHDHVLFVGQEVSGFIDYGAMRIDSPTTDLARLLGSFVPDQLDRWRLAVDSYQATRRLGSDERRLLSTLDRVNPRLSAVNWLRWLFVDGRRFEAWETVIRRLREITLRLAAER